MGGGGMSAAYHSVVWGIDRDDIYGTITCTAPVGADCRLGCPSGCESVCDHDLTDMGECLAVTWINESGDTKEFYEAPNPHDVTNGPVIVRWDHKIESWVWRYPDTDTKVPEHHHCFCGCGAHFGCFLVDTDTGSVPE